MNCLHFSKDAISYDRLPLHHKIDWESVEPGSSLVVTRTIHPQLNDRQCREVVEFAASRGINMDYFQDESASELTFIFIVSDIKAKDYSGAVYEAIKEMGGSADAFTLRRIFGQKVYSSSIRKLLEANAIRETSVHSGGRGRPKKIYHIVDSNKGSHNG